MVKFLHIADTHLGCKTPVEVGSIRESDFITSFKQCIELAINENVDFIIHSGDVFHSSNVSPLILLETIKILKELKKENIPFIAIKGNHDIKGLRKITSFDILKETGLLVEPTIKSPIEINEAKIYGISEVPIPPNELKTTYYSLFFSIKENYKIESDFPILLTHTVSRKYVISILESDPRYLPSDWYPYKKFKYIALGHYHRYCPYFKKENCFFVLPGSTERTELSEAELKEDKYAILVENNNIFRKKLNTRKFEIREFEIKDDNGYRELINYLKSVEPQIIAKILVKILDSRYKKFINDISKMYKNIILEIIDLSESSEEKILTNNEEFKEFTIEEIINESILSSIQDFPEDERNRILEIVKELLVRIDTSREAVEHYLRSLYDVTIPRSCRSSNLHIRPKSTRQKTLFDEL